MMPRSLHTGGLMRRSSLVVRRLECVARSRDTTGDCPAIFFLDKAMVRHGAFSWCELMTTDVQAATQFYTALFGWTTEEMPGMAYTVVKTGAVGIGGIMAIPSSHATGAPPHWGTSVTVDDVDATARKAEELGATTLMPLTDIPNVGRFYTFQDPQGAVISIITYRR